MYSTSMGKLQYWTSQRIIHSGILLTLLLICTQGFSQDLFQVPPKNSASIATIQGGIMTDDQLINHIKSSVALVEANMSEQDRQMSGTIMTQFRPTDTTSLADVANGFWISANHAPALLLMGKACLADNDPDNLNNFAAFIEMAGRPDLAIPILNKLNNEIPQHSTILNNLGQAWFRLGDIAKAEKYLDSAIFLYANHSQANLTQAIIANSRGNKTKAIDCLKKSINEAYTPEKQQMLEQLGYTISKKDIRRRVHMPEDPLGFDNWLSILPPWPAESAQSLEVRPMWDAFFKAVEAETSSLRAEIRLKQQELNEQLRNAAKQQKAMSVRNSPFNLTPKEKLILKIYADEYDGSPYETDYYKYTGEWWTDHLDIIMKTLSEKMSVISDKPGWDEDHCPEIIAAHNQYIADAAEISQKYFWAVMDFKKRDIARKAYVATNTESNQIRADMAVLNAKVEFLNIFTVQLRPTVITNGYYPPERCPLAKEEKQNNKLAVWEDTHCQEVSFVMPAIGSWAIRCNIAEFHLDPLILPFEFHYKENLITNEWISCSGSVKLNIVKGGGEYDFTTEKGKLEVGVGKKLGEDFLKGTPVKAGMEVAGFVEIGKNGISDYGVKGGVSIKPNVGEIYKNDLFQVGPKTGKLEVSGKVSWNSGPSGDLKAQLLPAFFLF